MEQGMEALAAWARTQGGIEAIIAAARQPQSEQSIRTHEQAASAHDANEPTA